MLYSYQAKDRTGRTVTGALDAPDERQAAQDIRDMGYFPMRLAPQRGGAATLEPPAAPGSSRNSQSAYSQSAYSQSSYSPDTLNGAAVLPPLPKMSPGLWLLAHLVYPLWSGVGLRDMALMYRQFAAMLYAGVPIYQCLTSLIQQTGNGVLRGQLRKITARVQQGEMLTVAMGEFPWVFTDFHRAMVSAGETSGRMDIMMNRLSAALEQEYALRNNIKRETWYPIVTLLMSFLLPPLVLIVVSHDIQGYLHQAVYPLLESGAVVLAIYVAAKLLSQFKVFFDGLAASVPGIGGAIRMVALARFARALASLYAAGVGIPEAIQYAAAATGNAYMARRMVMAIPAIQSGRGIAESLAATRIFPPMVVSMLGTGEQTGGLDAIMDKVAEYYEQESAIRLHQVSVTLGAFAMIIAGIRVAILLIHFYTSYFDKMNDLANPDSN